MSISGAWFFACQGSFLFIKDNLWKLILEILRIFFLLANTVKWVKQRFWCWWMRSLFINFYRLGFCNFTEKFFLLHHKIFNFFLLHQTQLLFGNKIIFLTCKTISIFCHRRFVMICWIWFWILRYRFAVINCYTFQPQSERIFIITFFSLFSIFGIYYRRWCLLHFFNCWRRLIKLICTFMNSDPFLSWNNKYHDVILLFCDFSNTTKHENSSWDCMRNHYMPFSFLRPISCLIFIRFWYFSPFQCLKIKKPHVIKDLIWVSSSKNIKFIFNNAWTDISSGRWPFYTVCFHFWYCNSVIIYIF